MEELYKYYNLDGFGIAKFIRKNFNFMKKIPNIFILDIDGVMTTGQFLYSKNGKEYKILCTR